MEFEPFTWNLILNDQKAIEIVTNISDENKSSVIEKYIIIGDMVVSHASIRTSKESVEAFFEPLRNDIELIRKQLAQVVPIVLTPVKKGEITEEAIFQSLQEHFLDDIIENVSGMGKYSDILATIQDTSNPVLIEVKNYRGTVPSSEVDKFWRDMEYRNSRYGIFVSLNSSIAKCSGCINLKHNLDRTAVFVVDSDLNYRGHIFAFHIIKKIVELEALKKKDAVDVDIEKTMTKINESLQSIQRTSKAIEDISITAESLKLRCVRDLEGISSTARVLRKRIDEQLDIAFDELREVSE